MCVRQTDREGEHSQVPVTADYSVPDLQVGVADPGCFDSEGEKNGVSEICV